MPQVIPQDEQSRQMQALLEEFSRGTESAERFCAAKSIPIWKFYHWRKKLGFDFSSHRTRKKPATFVRLDITPKKIESFIQPTRQSYEILFYDGTRLFLPMDFTEERVSGLLRVLRGR